MVSIIIPYKNPLPYFEDCLKSIVNQSHKKLQIILVNDHSTDDSEKLAFKYSIEDSRIKLVNNVGKGIVDALNTGSEIAKGKYITRMDADDIMSENKIEILRHYVTNEENISLVMHGLCKYFQQKITTMKILFHKIIIIRINNIVINIRDKESLTIIN